MAQQATPDSNGKKRRTQGIFSNSHGPYVKRPRINKDGVQPANTLPINPSAPTHIAPRAQNRPTGPSLTSHLLTRDPDGFVAATQQPFLQKAGDGTLPPTSLSQWLSQDSHITRGYISFIGALIGRIRLPQLANTHLDPMYRTMDLLISALNNARREMSFLEITTTKYGIPVPNELAWPSTKAFLDMFTACTNSTASLLEGLTVLWAMQHVCIFPYSGRVKLILTVLSMLLGLRVYLRLGHVTALSSLHDRCGSRSTRYCPPSSTNPKLDQSAIPQFCRCLSSYCR